MWKFYTLDNAILPGLADIKYHSYSIVKCSKCDGIRNQSNINMYMGCVEADAMCTLKKK